MTRIAAFGLIGAIAEGSTHIREAAPGRDGLDLVVLTGVLPGDTTFATHGHLVRIRVVPGVLTLDEHERYLFDLNGYLAIPGALPSGDAWRG